MINAGKYKYQINIYKVIQGKDKDGFPANVDELILSPYAYVKTTKGITLIRNYSDFEKAFTNFTIRYSQTVENAYYESANSNRKIKVVFRNKTYEVQYLNNVDEANIELEMQCKEVLK